MNPDPEGGAVAGTEAASLVVPVNLLRTRLDTAAIFGRRAPLEVDVGCGKGRFLVARAKAHPGTDFVGIDRQSGRVRKVERKALREGLANVRLIVHEASHVVGLLLPEASVTAFHIYFPDPWPKRRHHERRLVNEAFASDLVARLVPDGTVHVLTDHADYFAEIRKVLSAQPMLAETEPPTAREEPTNFEALFEKMNVPIHGCSFRRRARS